MTKDYYKILGVSRNATKEEIKRAYKRLAKLYHPDLNKGDKEKEERFKEINEAYRVLSDDKLREQYDRFGTTEETGFQAGDFGFGFRDFDFENFGFDDFFENISDIFGFPFTRKRKRGKRIIKGEDIYKDVEITLEEAVLGSEKELNIKIHEKCSACNGTGAEETKECPDCGGTGFIKHTRRTPIGIITTTTTCPRCGGSGVITTKKCRVCNGKGFVVKNKKIVLKIPKGIEDGAALRIRGAGHLGDIPGDLYVIVHIKKHPVFERKGNDLYYELKITYPEAVLGCEREIKLINGRTRKIRIPAGTQPNQEIIIRGEGVFNEKTRERGNLVVIIKVIVPKRITREERTLLEKLKKIMKKS